MNLVRGAVVMLLVLALSFALGFFVIARMMPAGAKTGSSGTGPMQVTNADGDNGASRAAVPQRTEVVPSAPATHAPPPARSPSTNGPTIDPATDDNTVQQPGSVDKNTSQDTTSGNGDTPSPAATTSDEKKPKHARHNKHHQDDTTEKIQKNDTTEKTQTPTSPDTQDNANNPDSGDTQNGDTSTAANANSSDTDSGTGLYRVQIGVYSTREKAEEVAQNANDKGFSTTIHPITRDGRTYYRVQHNIYRNKANAEAAKQRLLDAGFDAYIATQ